MGSLPCCRFVIVALVTLLSMTANAITYTQDLSFDPETGHLFTTGGGIKEYISGALPGFTPQALAVGDVLQVNVTFTDGKYIELIEADTGPEGLVDERMLSAILGSNDPNLIDFSILFVDVAGDLLLNPAVGTSTSCDIMGCFADILTDLTDSFFAFGGLEFTFTVPIPGALPVIIHGVSFTPQADDIKLGRSVVPVPASLSLILLGILGIGYQRRRKPA